MSKEYFYLENSTIDKVSIDDINSLAFFILSLNIGHLDEVNCVKKLRNVFSDSSDNNYFLAIYNKIRNDKSALVLLKIVINLCIIENNLHKNMLNQSTIDLYKRFISNYNKLLTDNKRHYRKNRVLV